MRCQPKDLEVGELGVYGLKVIQDAHPKKVVVWVKDETEMRME